MTAYYHGGVPGLRRGDRILPPSRTGARNTTADPNLPAELRAEVEQLYDPHRVYLAADPDDTRLFAALYPHGDIYQVTPDREPEPDPDWGGEPGGSVATTGATVVRVVERAVAPAPYMTALEGGR